EQFPRAGGDCADVGLREDLPVDWINGDALPLGIEARLQQLNSLRRVIARRLESGPGVILHVRRDQPIEPEAVIERQTAGHFPGVLHKKVVPASGGEMARRGVRLVITLVDAYKRVGVSIVCIQWIQGAGSELEIAEPSGRSADIAPETLESHPSLVE